MVTSEVGVLLGRFKRSFIDLLLELDVLFEISMCIKYHLNINVCQMSTVGIFNLVWSVT